MTRWPHQLSGVQDCLLAIAEGYRRILLTSPTGGGKTQMLADLIQHYLERQEKVVLYSNRRMLIDQLSRSLAAKGFDFGIRAARTKCHLWKKLQIASMQTEGNRSLGADAIWDLHDAALVLVDEAHIQTGPRARHILDKHHADGAVIVGVTATPLDLDDLYDHLVVAGCNSSLRECGALVPAYHYGPDEPDLRAHNAARQALKEQPALGEDLSKEKQVKAIMAPGVFGRVFDWAARINPELTKMVLFGPGQGEALWFAERFHAKGISAAHIDSECCWINGKTYRTDQKARQGIADMHEAGAVQVVTNRYVLREGIDWPWILHLIMAFVPGSLKTYLQIGGRALRACLEQGKTCCKIQDHGGGYWRHGSLNMDRHWELGQTSRQQAALWQDRKRNPQPGDPPQPARCPQCAAILMGFRCRCGYEIPRGSRRSRPVIETDGQLREMTGDPFRRRKTMRPSDEADRLWEQMYWRARSDKWDATFLQAEAMFASEQNWDYPPRGRPLMPTDPKDWIRRVKDVPMEKLVPKEPVTQDAFA